MARSRSQTRTWTARLSAAVAVGLAVWFIGPWWARALATLAILVTILALTEN